MATEKATFAAGCFWGVQEAFDSLPGVISTTVGYMGGNTPVPTYQQVCTGETGHAESVEVVYDAAKISYRQLLEVFWKSHDPTQKDGQGWDIGSQYRSAIFFHNPEQETEALASREALMKAGLKVVTEIVPASEFYSAEEYHQHYLEKRRGRR